MSKPKKAPRELVEEGSHNAVCVGFIDLGTQESKNEKFPARPRALLQFELVDLSTKERPVIMSREVTFSGHKKSKLAEILKGWLGVKDATEYDMEGVLNKPALLTVVHAETDAGEFANIENVSGLPKGTKIKKPTATVQSLFLDDTYDAEVFEGLPEWIQNKIIDSPEFQEISKPKKGKGKK